MLKPSKLSKESKSALVQSPELKVLQGQSDLTTLATDVIVNHLEHNLKLREMPLTDRLKKGMLR